MDTMNTKLNMLALVIALAAAAPAQAESLDEQIRNQGIAATATLHGEVRTSFGLPAAPAPPVRYPLAQAIRIQGRRAVRSVALEMDLQRYRQAATAVVAAE